MKRTFIDNENLKCKNHPEVRVHAKGLCSPCYHKCRRIERIGLVEFRKCINHPEKNHNSRGLCSECYAKWRRENFPEKIKEEHRRNKIKYLQRAKSWQKSEKGKRTTNTRYHRRKKVFSYRMTMNLRSRIFKALKGKDKSEFTIELIGCNINYFKNYISNLFQEGMNWENYGKWHIDHIKPCSSFELSDPEQQKICFHYSNLQPLWALDNLKKGQKI